MKKIELPEPWKDIRGHIQNLLELDSAAAPIRGVSIIFSRARTTRSNHYHREDGHWLYVVSGMMHYWERPLDVASYPQAPTVVSAGEMVFTGPLLWHRTYFPDETVLLSLSLRPRDHASHEEDVVREPAQKPMARGRR